MITIVVLEFGDHFQLNYSFVFGLNLASQLARLLSVQPNIGQMPWILLHEIDVNGNILK